MACSLSTYLISKQYKLQRKACTTLPKLLKMYLQASTVDEDFSIHEIHYKYATVFAILNYILSTSSRIHVSLKLKRCLALSIIKNKKSSSLLPVILRPCFQHVNEFCPLCKLIITSLNEFVNTSITPLLFKAHEILQTT